MILNSFPCFHFEIAFEVYEEQNSYPFFAFNFFNNNDMHGRIKAVMLL